MRALSVLILCLLPAMSCQPLPPPGGGEEGQPGAAGARGPAGRDGKDAVVAGSRLRPLYYTGTDGTRFAVGAFYDSERRERCMIVPIEGGGWPDGPWVCAPLQARGYVPSAEASRYVRFALQE